MQGAVAGMITGLVFTGAYIWFFKYGGGRPEQYIFGITPEGIGTLGMLLNTVVALIVSSMTPPPPAEVQVMVENIRVPSGAGAASEH